MDAWRREKGNIDMKARILVYGAGAIGSIFAGKLKKAGFDVTILARGKRYEEITTQGLILKSALTNRMETYQLPCIQKLEENDVYDYILIVVQNTQIDTILPVLKTNLSKNIVFVVNNPSGYEKYSASVGIERVMIGFPSAGGERKDGVVTYFIGRGIARIMQTTTFGEVNGQNTERLKKLVRLFHKAGFDPTKSRNMDAWQKSHIAFVIPIAHALYYFDCNNYQLAKSRKIIRKMILAIREGFKALKENGIQVEPKKLNYYYLPLWLLTTIYQFVLNTKIAEYAMAKHSVVAKEEIEALNKQFLSMYEASSFTQWKDLHLTISST